jgi:hypothetical protein
LNFPGGGKNRHPDALNEPGRTKGVRKIAEDFGVSPSTVLFLSVRVAA